MRIRIEKILSLLKAEGIHPYDEDAVKKSLSETVMPKQNITAYMEWITNRRKEQAKTF